MPDTRNQAIPGGPLQALQQNRMPLYGDAFQRLCFELKTGKSVGSQSTCRRLCADGKLKNEDYC